MWDKEINRCVHKRDIDLRDRDAIVRALHELARPAIATEVDAMLGLRSGRTAAVAHMFPRYILHGPADTENMRRVGRNVRTKGTSQTQIELHPHLRQYGAA